MSTILESEVPTEMSPEQGCVTVAGIRLLDGIRFEDEGAHFIRAVECDVRGEGDSLDEAVHDFVVHALDLSLYLAELVENREASDRETHLHALLARRFTAVVNAYEEEARRRRDALREVLRLKRATLHRHQWRPTPRNHSRALSHA
jgi:hypothetical protein